MHKYACRRRRQGNPQLSSHLVSRPPFLACYTPLRPTTLRPTWFDRSTRWTRWSPTRTRPTRNCADLFIYVRLAGVESSGRLLVFRLGAVMLRNGHESRKALVSAVSCSLRLGSRKWYDKRGVRGAPLSPYDRSSLCWGRYASCLRWLFLRLTEMEIGSLFGLRGRNAQTCCVLALNSPVWSRDNL